MQKISGAKDRKFNKDDPTKSHFKAIRPDVQIENCENCTYGEQDIDTFPCAKCHTRH